MAKNKNKKASTLAAKKATKTVAAPEKTEEVKDVAKEASKKEEKKPTPEHKATAYESYVNYLKHPHMGVISQELKKNDKSIEEIHTTFKNHDTNETVSLVFPVSNVKEGDGIDLTKLREQAEKGLKEYYAEKAKKETKKEEKKEEKKSEKTEKPKKESKKKEEKVIVPEVVDPTPEKKSSTKISIAQGLANLANKERMDENHQVEFLGLIHKEYLSNKDRDIPAAQKAAMQEVFDGGMCQLTLLYAAQLEAEGRAILKGVNITKEVFPLAKAQFAELYGVDIKALPGKSDGQMTIEFQEVPVEVKKAAKEDAKATAKIKEIPEPDPKMEEPEKLDVLRAILSRTNATDGEVKCRMATNIHDAIEWARKAFEIKSDSPEVTLATMYQKFNNAKTLCLSGYMRRSWGATTVNRSPFITHATISKDFDGIYSEEQVAKLVQVMQSAYAEYTGSENKDFASLVSGVNNINSGITEDILKAIIAKEETIEFSPEGLEAGTKGNGIPGAKIYEQLQNRYAITDSPELLKSKLQLISGLYKNPVVRLSCYVDESAYSK